VAHFAISDFRILCLVGVITCSVLHRRIYVSVYTEPILP